MLEDDTMGWRAAVAVDKSIDRYKGPYAQWSEKTYVAGNSDISSNRSLIAEPDVGIQAIDKDITRDVDVPHVNSAEIERLDIANNCRMAAILANRRVHLHV